MEKSQSAKVKVAVDTGVNQRIPTVAVAEPDDPQQQPPKDMPVASPPSFIQRMIKHVVTLVMDFLETIVVAMSIFVVVYLLLVQPHEVKGSSMEKTFHNNEYILTDKISYRFRQPHRGEVVIFKSPNNPDVDYIKRIIGLPGERIKVEKGKVYVNDVAIDEPYLSDLTLLFPGSPLQEGVDLNIPSGEYFVMGDNRPHSSDSREFGPIPKKLIIGRAFFRYWPPQVIGTVKTAQYGEIPSE